MTVMFSEAMEIDFNACFMKGNYFMVDIKNTSVINGIGNDERNNMKLLVRQVPV